MRDQIMPRDDYFGLTDEDFQAVVQAIRTADKSFESAGGGTRHWLRDEFLPELDAAGYRIVRKP